ncbi:MAG: hypothetical protein ACO26H_03265 [Sediminibacterium sp.]
MISFIDFLVEEKENHNENFGVAYETATALHTHNSTGAKDNKDPEYRKRIEEVEKKGREAFNKLPDHLKKRAMEAAKSSSDEYIKSLEKNHGIKAKDVTEVHHTSKGIDEHVGEKTDRIQNPHDILVKTKGGKMHGASLKATQGTLSNNGIGTFDSQNAGHIKTDVSSIWEKGKKKAGLEGKSGAEIKAARDDEKVKAINKETQAAAAKHHADQFNNASPENQRKHLKYIMKSEKPAIPYDYVNGEKKKSVPSNELEHAQSIEKSKGFHAHQEEGSNLVKIHDEHGKHIATVEHRPTHGAFSGIQVNTKIGSMKTDEKYSYANARSQALGKKAKAGDNKAEQELAKRKAK